MAHSAHFDSAHFAFSTVAVQRRPGGHRPVRPRQRAGRLRPGHGRHPARHPPATTSSPRRSTRCAASSTAARSAPTPAAATVRASSRRCRMPSSARSLTFELPESRHATPSATAFLPTDTDEREQIKESIGSLAAEEGLDRARLARSADRPVADRRARSPARCRRSSSCSSPSHRGDAGAARSSASNWTGRRSGCASAPSANSTVYFPSLSCRTLVYKGMVTTLQLEPFYPDLSDERFASKLALVHSRYSTNTFPSWPLAQPFRMIAHNGEINTVQGNRNWMRARQIAARVRAARRHRPDPADRHPRRAATPPRSTRSSNCSPSPAGSLPHAVMMMVPEAWEKQTESDPARRAFYEYHSMLMEPWDGPAALRLHRRHPRRRDARPQRAAPRPVPGHRRRPRRGRQRDRRARHRPEPGRTARAGCAREDVPRRHRSRPAHRRRRDQVDLWRRPRRGAQWLEDNRINLTDLPGARAHRAPARVGGASPAHLRLHRGGGGHDPRADGAERRRAARRDGHRHPDRRARRRVRDCCSTTSPSSSRRSRTRRSTPSAKPSSPRSGSGSARSATCSPPTPEHAQQVILDFPVIDNDELVEDPAHRPSAGKSHHHDHPRPVPLRRGAAGAAEPARGDLRRGRRGDRGGRAVHRAERPRLQQGPRADPVAAHARRRAPPPHPAGEPHEGRPHRRGRRRARGAPRRAAGRLRGVGHQPVPGDGKRRGPRAPRRHHRHHARGGGART